MLTSCHESIEERAQRECKDFTEKNCPTPMQNMAITDSLVFYPETKTYTTYSRFCDKMDDPAVISKVKGEASENLKQNLMSSTSMQPFIDAGFNFRFIVVSDKNPKQVLLDITFKSKELKK